MNLSKLKIIFLVSIGIISFVAVVFYVNSYLYKTKASSPVYAVPASIPSDCSRAVEPELNAFIKGVPDGSTIKFPQNGCYKQNRRIEVKDKLNLVIDGNGSTFTTTSNGVVTKSVDANWLVLRGGNITIKNMTVRGDFTAYEGQPRKLATIGTGDPEFTEAQMGFGLYGTDTVYLTDVKAFNNWGDGVTTGPAHYADDLHHGDKTFTHNVFIKRMEVETVGRMCWGPTSGTNIWIEDSVCRDAWYGGIDAEMDGLDQPLSGHHYLRNTFDGFNHLGIFIPVAATNGSTRDIEIRGNKFLTYPDSGCSAPIHVGGYPDSNPAIFSNVIVEDNEMKTEGSIVVLDHVNGGSIQRNKMTGYREVGCAYPAKPPLTKVTNSTGVTVANNGVDAVPVVPTSTAPLPGSGTTPVPTVAPLSPTPTKIPSPTLASTIAPTTPPSSSSCPAPTNLTGTAGPQGSGKFDFTWSPSATASEYSLFYATAPDQPATIYAGPFPNSPASAFSLNTNIQYNFAVRAKCGSAISSNSNVVLVNLSGATGPTAAPTMAPNSTGLSLNLFLHGLGKGGDSANPNAGGNTSPRRTQRNVKIEVFNSQNQLVLTKDGVVGFNPATGNFLGVLDAGTQLTSGIYTVKVKVDQFLKVLIPGIQNLSTGRINVLPQARLVTGDMNNDNKINALDYNVLIDCYADLTPAANCSDPVKKLMADLTDDGSVNMFDYNLFLRELTNISGE
jgi:hypothetical protein